MNIHDWLALIHLVGIDSDETYSELLDSVQRRYAEASQNNSPLLMIAQALKVIELCLLLGLRLTNCSTQGPHPYQVSFFGLKPSGA